MHLVRIFRVMGWRVSGRVGWVFWMPLMSRDVWELDMLVEGEP